VTRPVFAVWSAWLLLMAGANLATPLYAVYASRFDFSSLVLTSIFATYAFVLVPALIVFGRLSDRFGRKPVLFLGLSTACGGLALFAGAQSALWLYAARAVQGLAVGMISGAATAALVELDPHDDRRRAAMFAGLAQAGGSSAGPLFAGVLAQWAPHPLTLCFVVTLGATALAAGVALTVPEPAAREREPWRIEWPRVPRALRADFARVSVTAATVWASVALFLSIVPSYVRVSLETENLALIALIASVALVASCAAQIVVQRSEGERRRDQGVGLVLLVVGLAALVVGAPFHSLAALLVGALAAGTGHGVAFLNAQQELNDLAPAERRGEVTAAFISCIYFLVATSVITTGALDRAFSLTLSVATVAIGLIVVAATVTVWQWRGPESNRRHHGFQPCALPTELPRPDGEV
jgi:predicted MFS family arabinose efflux permease